MTIAPSSSLNVQLDATFAQYLDAYFTRRDFSAVERFLGTAMSGAGTGLDETSFGDQNFLTLFARDIAQAPNPVEFEVQQKHISTISEKAGLVFATLNISTIIAGQTVRIRGLRMSVLITRHQDGFRIEHLHVSLPTDAHGGDEAYPVRELEERNLVLARLVEERTRDLAEALQENQRLAITDKLTGLYNRRMLDERLQTEILRCERYPVSLALILLDIDYFKTINDRHGHLAGDNFLVAFSGVVGQRLRKTDLLGRWGGEEFLLICPNTGNDDALNLAEQIRASVAGCDFGIDEIRTVSAGVSAFHVGDDVDILMARVDRALYSAKQQGRNRVCLAKPTSDSA